MGPFAGGRFLGLVVVLLVVCCDFLLAGQGDWLEVELIKGRTKVVRKKGIGILSHFPDQYKVSLEFYANRNGEKWGNIVQFTPGGRKATPFGEHIATVYYHGEEQQLMVTSSVSGNKDFHTVKELPPNQWHKVEIAQEKLNEDFYYSVTVNGQTLTTAINTHAKTYRNVTIFTGAPWYKAIEGDIQNLIFYYKPRCIDTGRSCALQKSMNYCTKFKTFMMRECRATCGFCSTSSGSKQQQQQQQQRRQQQQQQQQKPGSSASIPTDVVNCKRNNGGCSHTCQNMKCRCPKGFVLSDDKRNCRDINECARGNGGCHQKCVNKPGSYSCACKSGYTMEPDGRTCADINECFRNPNICEHMCENTKGSYRCTCMDGFVMDGNKCKYDCPPLVPVTMCAANPCRQSSCAANPTARCITNYCGGCNARFYDTQTGKKIDCSPNDRKTCEDKSGFCRAWKKKGFCDRFKDFMSEQCAHQCRFCYGGREFRGPKVQVIKPTLGPKPTAPKPVDGNWGSWSRYSRCTETCGGGAETRTRSCDNPKPRAGGRVCPGSTIESRRCNTQRCPPKYVVRTRPTTTTTTTTTTTQAPRRRPSGGSSGCGGRQDHSICASYDNSRRYYYCNRGGWISKHCPQLCGTCASLQQQLTTTVMARTAAPGKDAAPGSSDLPGCAKRDRASCTGYEVHKEAYCRQGWVRRNCAEMCGLCTSSKPAATNAPKTRAPSRVHGSWGSWGSYSTCSKTCGGGSQKRTRVCDNPPPSNGGRSCQGDGTQNRQCNTQVCQVVTAAPSGSNFPACQKVDHSSCVSYERYKSLYCTRGWVKTNCGEMCGFCSSKTAAAPAVKMTKRPTTRKPIRRTAAPTRAPTRAAKVTGCTDHSVCRSYEKMKSWACTRRWISKNCRNMCGTCRKYAPKKVIKKVKTPAPTRRTPVTRKPKKPKKKVVSGKVCKKADHKVCKSYVRRRQYYCRRWWMKHNCAGMCGFCKIDKSKGRRKKVSPTKRPRQKPRTQKPRPKKVKSVGGLPVCVKKDHSICQQYSKWAKSYCSQGWIQKNCKAMCKTCSPQKKKKKKK